MGGTLDNSKAKPVCLKILNTQVPTLPFNVIYHSWFSNFSITFSSSASSISKNILFFLTVHSFFWELYLNSISFFPFLCALGLFPAVILFLHARPATTFSGAQEKTLQRIGGPQVSDVLAQANRWDWHQENKLLNLSHVPSQRAKPTPDPGNTNVHRPSLLKLLWAQQPWRDIQNSGSDIARDMLTRTCLGEHSSSSPAETRPALFLVKEEFHRPLRKLHACTSRKAAAPD